MFRFLFTLYAVFILVSSAGANCWSYYTRIGGSYACDNGAIRPNYESSINSACANTNNPGGAVYINCGGNGLVDKCPVCYGSSLSDAYVEYTCCSSACEKDSLLCVRDGGNWEYDVNTPTCGGYSCKKCDSTFTCVNYPFFRCVDVPASGEITCIDGNCTGLPYSMWYTEYRSECHNECGVDSVYTLTSDTTYSLTATCQDSVKCSPKEYCYSSGNQYFIFQKCLVGNESVGNVNTQFEIPHVISAGQGSCRSVGMPNTNFPNSGGLVGNTGGGTGGGGGGTPDGIPDDCLLYGIGCPSNVPDSTNYNDDSNRNPTKCYCEPYDGIGSMSLVICPDGSRTMYYFSCEEWKNMHKSSSSGGGTTPASSSSTAGGGVSSGAVSSGSSDQFNGKYPEYPTQDDSYKKNVQGALSGTSGLLSEIKSILADLKKYFTSDEQFSDLESISLPSVVPPDSSTFSGRDSLMTYFDSLLTIIPDKNTLIDTSSYVNGAGTCPIITGNFGTACKAFKIFVGNNDLNMRFNFADFFGVNLCILLKSIITAFATLVSFLVGIKLFRLSGGIFS